MKTKSKGSVVLGGVILFLVIGMLLSGWLFMLMLGALASLFAAENLAIGFWPSLGLGVLMNLVFGGFYSSGRV